MFYTEPIKLIRVDPDISTKTEIAEELVYWEQQFEYACEIDDKEGRKDIMKVLNLLNMWLDDKD